MDILIIVAAIAAVFLILKIAFKVLKLALLLGIAAIVVYYLINFGFLKGLL